MKLVVSDTSPTIIEQLRNAFNLFLSETFVLEILKRCGELPE